MGCTRVEESQSCSAFQLPLRAAQAGEVRGKEGQQARRAQCVAVTPGERDEAKGATAQHLIINDTHADAGGGRPHVLKERGESAANRSPRHGTPTSDN